MSSISEYKRKLHEAQIAHLKQHQAAFDADHGAGRTIEEYFEEYAWEYEDLYERLCADLGITPRVTSSVSFSVTP